MKAARIHAYGGPEVLVYEDVPDPEPGAGQVLIRVEAASVNFSDVMRRRNDVYPKPSPLPFIPGGEVAGEVVALGEGVEGPAVGTKVFAVVGEDGATGYAELTVANAAQAIPLPPGLASVRACALVVAGLTAMLTVRDAGRLQAGESVFVQAAAGGVGSYAVQIAKLLGAGTVIGGVGSEDKREAVLALGADHVVNYGRPGWADEVRRLSDGRGADVVLDMVGGDISELSRTQVLGTFGRQVVFGLVSQRSVTFDPQTLYLAGSQEVIGFNIAAWLGAKPQIAFDGLQRLIGHVLAGEVKVPISRVLPLSQAADAHRLLETRQTTGKVVLQP